METPKFSLHKPPGLELTAQELALRYKADHPQTRLGYTTDGAAMGYFADGRWWVHASGTITGEWVRVDGKMPLINGERPYPDNEFIEV